MTTTILIILLVGSWTGFYFYRKNQLARIEKLDKSLKKIEKEEQRIFDFLHSLGESLSANMKIADLHKVIVDKTMAILSAHGGVLYLKNERENALVPRYISENCPPLIEVPKHILAQQEQVPTAIRSYLQLHAVANGEGLLGTAEPLLVQAGDPRLETLSGANDKTMSAMICPLMYNGEHLGVLAVANGPMSTAFTVSDFSLFQAIANQSAFTLYSASVYSQANEKKLMDRDLRMAEEIQRILLPSTAPELQRFEVGGVNIPARQMSGDYFDLNIQVDPERYGIAIADVSGKGVPASLVMAMCRSVLRTKAPGEASPAHVLHEVNRLLYPDIKEDMFISMAYVILNDADSSVTLCRAGHDAPLLYSAKTKEVTKVNPPGMALGIDRGDVFNRITGDFPITMESGDCLILYTDGVTEALDGKGIEFGMKRTILSIQASAANGVSGIITQLTDELHEYMQREPQNDDITLIVIRKK